MGEIQTFRKEPHSVMVSEGEDVELQCAVDNQQGRAQWTKDGFALGFERDVPGYPRYKYKGNAGVGEHDLLITGVTLQDDGEYQCQVGPTGNTLPIWSAANVTVIVPPSSISIVGWKEGSSVEVLSGASFVLQCLVEDARPIPTIQWLKNGALQSMEDQQDEELPGRRNRLLSVRSRIAIHPTPDDDGKHFTCKGSHVALETPTGYLSATISLSVLHLPDPPIIKGYKDGQVLRAEKLQDFSCIANGGNPRPYVKWYRNDVLVDDSMIYEERRVINTYRLTITEKEDRANLECRVTSDLLESPLVSNMTLDVHYPASFVKIEAPSFVRRNEHLTLVCESGGSNPASSVSWNIDGREVDASSTNVTERPTGGWTTKSIIEKLSLDAVLSEAPAAKTQLNVECLAFNSEFSNAVSQIHTILIVNPPGKPILEGLDGTLIAGKEALISCTSFGGNPPPSISLFKEGVKLTTKVAQKGQTAEALTEIKVVDSDNNLQVTCQVDHPSSESFFSTSQSLSVHFPPPILRGRAVPPTVNEGEEVLLTCESASSHPPANITWSVKGTPLEGASQHYSDGDFGGKITRSQIKIPTTAEEDRKIFLCSASNGLEKSVTANISVAVNHAPVWIVKPPSYVDIQEGDDLILTASASARPGPITYKWWKDGKLLTEATGRPPRTQDGSLRLERVSRASAGNYTLEVENPRGKLKVTFILDVLYPPNNLHAPTKVTVNEDSLAVMECSANGNPNPTISWTKLNRSDSLASGKGSARLFIDQTSRFHTGVYICTASNAIAVVAAEPSKLIVKHAPIIIPSQNPSPEFYAHLGGNGRLDCLAKAAPKPTFLWYSPNENIMQNGSKYYILGPELVDGLSLWKSTLSMKSVEDRDFATYKCEIHNMFGLDKGMVRLLQPLIPHTPTNLKVVNVTSSGTVVFTWTSDEGSESNSGSNPPVTSYIVRYWEDGDQLFEEKEIPASKYSTASISFVTPGRVYVITLAAMNKNGASGFAHPPLTVHIPGVMGEASSSSTGVDADNDGGSKKRGHSRTPSGWRVPRLLLLITTLTGAALLALNIAIIACFVRRRKRERNISVSSSKTTSLGVYYAPQISPSMENGNGTGTGITPISPATTPRNQILSSVHDKAIPHSGSNSLLPIDEESSHGNFSSQGNQFSKPPTIPLDLLEGSNISLTTEESPVALQSISSFSSNNNVSSSADKYENIEMRKPFDAEEMLALSSYSNTRMRSPKGAQVVKSNDDAANPDPTVATRYFSPPEMFSAGSFDNESCSHSRTSPSHAAFGSGFKTLESRKNKKEQPKFATLQKAKPVKPPTPLLNPEELTYATINIKTSPRPRQPKIKLKPDELLVLPLQSDSRNVCCSPQSEFNEAPRYINLRTFRESTSLGNPAAFSVESNLQRKSQISPVVTQIDRGSLKEQPHNNSCSNHDNKPHSNERPNKEVVVEPHFIDANQECQQFYSCQEGRRNSAQLIFCDTSDALSGAPLNKPAKQNSFIMDSDEVINA